MLASDRCAKQPSSIAGGRNESANRRLCRGTRQRADFRLLLNVSIAQGQGIRNSGWGKTRAPIRGSQADCHSSKSASNLSMAGKSLSGTSKSTSGPKAWYMRVRMMNKSIWLCNRISDCGAVGDSVKVLWFVMLVSSWMIGGRPYAMEKWCSRVCMRC